MSQGPKVNWWILGGGMAVLLGFVALMLYGFTQDPRELEYDVLVGKRAPALSLTDMDGNEVSLEDLRGKPVVVNFWSTWCIPCRQEHPLLEELAKVEGIQLLGINYKDKPENARRFLGSLGNPYQRVGADTGGRTAIEWGVYGVPETFVVDGEGTIRYKFIGPLSPESYYDVFLPELQKIMDGNKS